MRCRLLPAGDRRLCLSLRRPSRRASQPSCGSGPHSRHHSDPPVAQEGVNVATTIRDRCMANVLALESREGERVLGQAGPGLLRLVHPAGVQEGFRQHLAAHQPGFDINKLSLAATHTHTSPMVLKSPYNDKDTATPCSRRTTCRFSTSAWVTPSRRRGPPGRGSGRLGIGPRRGRPQSPRGLPRWDGQDARQHQDPQFSHIEATRITPSIFCAFLRCPAAAQGDRHYDGLYSPGSQRPGDQRRFLAARARVTSPAARAGTVRAGIRGSSGRPDSQTPVPQGGRVAYGAASRVGFAQETARRIVAAFDDVAPLIAKDIRTEVPFVHLFGRSSCRRGSSPRRSTRRPRRSATRWTPRR